MSTISSGTTSTTTLVHSGDTTGSLVFKTNDTGSGGTTAVTIDTSQQVGITATPTQKLSIGGSTGTYGQNFLYTGAGGPYTVAEYSITPSTGEIKIGGTNTTGTYFTTFYTQNSERMRIDSSGNVGIGVTPKTYASGKALEVGFAANGLNGSQQAQLNVNCNLYYDGSWRYGGTGKGTLIQLTDGTVNIYTTTSSGTAGSTATLTTGPYVANGGTSWTNSSDEQLKNITGEIENALDKVGQLRAAQFTWKSDASNKPQVGLIAQDLQAVLPEVVVVPEKEVNDQGEQQYLGVNYDQVIPLLVASIKELKAINDQQAQTITALTARIEALENK
jgi:hypothetical protein